MDILTPDIGKWNYETHEYDPYFPDPKWVIVLYSPDMELPINCTSCGKRMTYGQGYTSQEIHNSFGMGYPVCDTCYEVECKTRQEHRNDEA